MPLAKAARLAPEKTSIREALGRAYFRSRRFAEAAEEFEAVVERYPVNDFAHFCLGRALDLLGDADRARRHLAIAANLRPERARLPHLPGAAAPQPSPRVRALVQRVAAASVSVDGGEVAGDRPRAAGPARRRGRRRPERGRPARRQGRALRIFDDADGRMNEPLGDREVLCVSQFTLYADTRKGNRPELRGGGARPRLAEPLYERFCERLGGQARACSAPAWRSSSSTTGR